MLVKLETAGLVCPFPLMEAKEAMAKLNKGDGIIIGKGRAASFTKKEVFVRKCNS